MSGDLVLGPAATVTFTPPPAVAFVVDPPPAPDLVHFLPAEGPRGPAGPAGESVLPSLIDLGGPNDSNGA